MHALPLSERLSAGRRKIVVAALALVGAIVVLAAAHAILGVGGEGAYEPLRDWAAAAAYVLIAGIVAMRAAWVARDRRPWIVLAVAVSLFAVGNILWTLWIAHADSPPLPSLADAPWLAFYPASYVGIVMLSRAERPRMPRAVALDGIVTGLGVAALGAALAFESVRESATGGTLAVVTNVSYSAFDLLLAALVVGLLGLRGWRLDQVSGLLGGGVLLLCGGDIANVRDTAQGAYEWSAVASVLYLSGGFAIALAAWQPRARVEEPRLDGWSMLLVPVAFTLAAMVLLVIDHFRPVETLAVVLSAVTVTVALGRAALTFRDVRDLAETRREAITDELTSLPNRRLFLRHLESSIRAARVVGNSMALLIVDLDHFKELNDTLGHHAGDVLLRQIGPRLTGALRSTDTVARIGGDEFAVILDVPVTEGGALRAAEKLRAAISEPFEVEGLRVRVGASIGIALFPKHASDGEQLFQRADVAMYEAKALHSGQQIYVRSRDTHSRERLELGEQLHRALQTGQIEIHFQPKAELATGRIAGAEALARWRHPQRGLLPPEAFIALAEQGGLSRDLTRRVLDVAMTHCAEWRADGHDLHVAVNTTVSDLLDARFPDEIAERLVHHGLPPEALVIEVTESSVLADPVRIGDVLAKLGELGVRISLDDFGTGYSSLTHLKALPVSEVKIDRSFVTHMSRDPADAAIVAATIQLAHALGMHVVAEGVAHEHTRRLLADAGADLVQGFLISPPLPAADLGYLLGERRVRTALNAGLPQS